MRAGVQQRARGAPQLDGVVRRAARDEGLAAHIGHELETSDCLVVAGPASDGRQRGQALAGSQVPDAQSGVHRAGPQQVGCTTDKQ